MGAKVSMEHRGDCLWVTVAGVIRTIMQIADYSSEYRKEAERLGLRRVLIDYRKARFLVDYHDLLKLGEYATDQGFHFHGLRIAAVCAPDGMPKHQQYETIAHNRSITYRAFTDETDAEAWLSGS